MGRNYAIFDTGIGRCGIVWSEAGIVAVQLPEAREIDTRRRLFRLYPEAREMRPPVMVEVAMEGTDALLRGRNADLSDVTLDVRGISAFNQRVYELTRGIPRGETRTYNEIASMMRRTGAAYSVAEAIAKRDPKKAELYSRKLVNMPYADLHSWIHSADRGLLP